MKSKDPSPTLHDKNTQSAQDYEFRDSLSKYIDSSPFSGVEKFENFSKYVPRQNLARFMARYELFKLVKDVQGSIIECGVLHGGGLLSFAQLSTILEPYNFQRRIVGFDTFDGFPSLDEKDFEGLSERKSEHLREGGFSAPDAHADIEKAIEVYNKNRFLNHFPKVSVVKGDFMKTSDEFLNDYPHCVVSLLYLDFDIYGPTLKALESFYPRMPKGAVLAFDELNEEAFPGETAAVKEYLGLNNIRVKRFDFEPRISYAVVGE